MEQNILFKHIKMKRKNREKGDVNTKMWKKTAKMWFKIHVQVKNVIVKCVCKENIMDTAREFGYNKTNEKSKKKTEE